MQAMYACVRACVRVCVCVCRTIGVFFLHIDIKVILLDS